VQVTSVGHAGFRIDTPQGAFCATRGQSCLLRVVFPIPDKQRAFGIGRRLATSEYCTSHTCKGPIDPVNLRAHVNKDGGAAPDYPAGPATELEKLGFHRFFATTIG